MNAQEIIARLREARNIGSMDFRMDAALRNLEIDLAGTAKEDFTCDVIGFDTVLSYLAKTNPEALELMVNPVHDTISDGKALRCKASGRGLPIIRIAACDHMKRRFPKAAYVNAYPTHLLVEHFG